MKTTYTKGIASLLFGCIALLFWGLAYPHHLHYQEQLQLFLFTPEYAIEKLSHPGGIAEYMAEFLTQFYYHAWAGAFIIALLLVVLQRQTGWLARQRGALAFHYPLTFLPSVALWTFLCDENALLAFAIALILTLCATMVYQLLFSHALGRIIFALTIMPLLYWLVGGIYLIFVLWVGFQECSHAGNNRLKGIGLLTGSLLIGIGYPLLAQELTQYPFTRLLTGIGYYRFPLIMPKAELVTAILALVIPWVSGKISFSRPKQRMGLAFAIAGLIVGCAFCVYSAYDVPKEEAMKYDYLTRTKQWDTLIKEAERKNPTAPFAVTCLNLALAKKGQLGDRMFEFYQNGTEGLIPEFQRDFTAPLPTSEVFYHLGMVNSSQRYMFEAMEAIPDYKKSGRAYQRLAETNLINGQYAVAAKYLRALQHTFFYSEWATNTMTYLNNEAKIDAHPEWGWLRKARYADDFLFSNTEMDVMLGRLLQQNKANKLAFEYLLAYVLQQKDLERFLQYYPLGKDLGYAHIPISYQEALIFVWTQQNPNFEGLPWSISRKVMDGVTEFAHIYMKQKNPESILREKYEKTFWYYLLFRK